MLCGSRTRLARSETWSLCRSVVEFLSVNQTMWGAKRFAVKSLRYKHEAPARRPTNRKNVCTPRKFSTQLNSLANWGIGHRNVGRIGRIGRIGMMADHRDAFRSF